MAKEGYEFFAFDQRGSGQSGGEKGLIEDLSYTAEDAAIYINKVKEIYGNLPVFLVGTSMGGVIALDTSELVTARGLVLFAPAFGLYKEPSLTYRVVLYILKCISQSITIRNPLTNPVTPNLAAMQIFLKSRLISFSDQVLAISVNSLIEGGDRTYKKSHMIRTPFTIIQGGCDYITSETKSRSFTVAKDKEYWFYPEMYHVAICEPEFDDIVSRLKVWVSQRLSKIVAPCVKSVVFK